MKDRLHYVLALILLYAAFIPAILVAVTLSLVLKKMFRLFLKAPSNHILILPAFFPGNAGYHWRVKKWVGILEQEGYRVKICKLWQQDEFNLYVQKISPLRVLYYLSKRSKQILSNAHRFDTLLVRRESLPYGDIGFHILERMQKVLFADRILDFDDDIAAAKSEPLNLSFFGRLLGMHQQPFTKSLQFYNRFMVGNTFLKAFVARTLPQINEHNDILVLPTCYEVDPKLQKAYSKPGANLVIGWLGSNGNQYVLDHITTELNALYENQKFELRVVSGKPYCNPKAIFPIVNRKWSLESEKREMLEFDIGIMPLTGMSHETGKSGFKLIQYMSTGLVTVSTSIGVNKTIVQHGVNGFRVHAGADKWVGVLLDCITQKENWNTIGENALKTIQSKYTFNANRDNLMGFLSVSSK